MLCWVRLSTSTTPDNAPDEQWACAQIAHDCFPTMWQKHVCAGQPLEVKVRCQYWILHKPKAKSSVVELVIPSLVDSSEPRQGHSESVKALCCTLIICVVLRAINSTLSNMAQRKRAGLITRRTQDRNLLLLRFLLCLVSLAVILIHTLFFWLSICRACRTKILAQV